MLDRRMSQDLDNYITGHYGEDQFRDEEEEVAQKHTPGPWKESNEVGGVYIRSLGQRSKLDRQPILLAQILGGPPDREANAARIVACVNACEGINPEAVPDLYRVVEEVAEHFAYTDSILGGKARAALDKAKGE